jgi:thiol peroxidase
MAKLTLGENALETVGELPAVGSKAPAFTLVKADLSETTLDEYKGNTLILNIFPSLDTPTCATSVREFNKRAAGKPNVKVLCVSADLPFALGRFCGAEGIKDVETASTFRSSFGDDYKVKFTKGILTGLMSRAVIVIDADGKVKYTEQVQEIANEPNYDAALAAL